MAQESEAGGRDPARMVGPRRVTLEPWGVTIGPVVHLTAERRRLRSCAYAGFAVNPHGSTLGGMVTGLDLRTPLDPHTLAELRRCLADFKVLFFRDQPLSQDQHVAFARQFGELEIHPFLPSNTEIEALVRFENEDTVGGFENGWHHDVTWRSCPSMGAVLRAIVVPETGGDTLFADMHAAYDGLDDGMKERIEGLRAVHDFTGTFGTTLDPDARAAMQERYPPVEHPVVHVHPVTGRKLLYVNRYFVTGIVGMEREEGIALIKELAAQAETVEYQCRFRWEPDSIAFWDNRAVQHYAASDYFPDRRIMERASIVGTRPT